MPASASPDYKKQVIRATELLFYSVRGLNVEEVQDLEKHTDYGHQIGAASDTYRYNYDTTHTLRLLSGIASVFQGDLQLSHPKFRDILPSTPFFNEASARLAHARIACWCLERIISAPPEDIMRFQTDQEDLTIPGLRVNFLSYALRYWVQHVKLAGPEAEKLGCVQRLLGDSSLLSLWTKAYWSSLNPAIRGNSPFITPLAIFAQHGPGKLVVYTMREHESRSYYQHECFQALRHAARSEQVSIVRKLLAVPTPADETLSSVMFDAFASRNKQIIQEVIQTARQRPQAFRDPMAALEMAAFHGHTDAVEMLIPMVSTQAIREDGSTTALLATAGGCLNEKGNLEVLKLLVAAHFSTGTLSDHNKNQSALIIAAKLGNPAITAFLAQQLPGTQIVDQFQHESYSEEEPQWWLQFWAALAGALNNQHHQALQALLGIVTAQRWKEPPGLVQDSLDTAIMGMPECSKVLISYLAKVKEPSQLKTMAEKQIRPAVGAGDVSTVQLLENIAGGLHRDDLSELLAIAVGAGDKALDLVKLLEERVSKACTMEIYDKALEGALAIAVKNRSLQVSTYLVKKGAPLNSRPIGGKTPLLQSVWQRDVDLTRLLLESGANANAIGDDDGWTPLHGAYDEPKILEMLIKAGADVNAKAPEGRTALWCSCRYGYKDSVAVLLKYKSNVSF